jgi:glycosyltransferase involved in cell wall biosynthesis
VNSINGPQLSAERPHSAEYRSDSDAQGSVPVSGDRTIEIVCGAGIVSGKEIVSLHLAHGLRAAGWNPEFVTSSWSDAEFGRRLEQDGFKYRRLRIGFISASFRLEPLLMTLDQLRYWPALAYGYGRLIKATAPRVVIHTNWHHALLLLPFLKPHRDIFWVHECFPNTSRYRHVLRAIAKRVSRVVCVSHAAACALVALGVPESHVVVIHNGLPPVDSIPARGGQPPLRVGIVGQIGPWKGHDDLIDALALLARDGEHATLSIFGTGNPEYVASLKRKVSKLRLDDKVQWCGFVRSQVEIYTKLDICVVPTRIEEPFATSALEAGGFGRPVICSIRGGLPEIIEHGVTGLAVEAQRPDLLANAIKSFARDPLLIKTMGEAARNRIQTVFSLEQFIARFTQVIAEIKVQKLSIISDSA